MPLSSSVLVNKEELLEILEAARRLRRAGGVRHAGVAGGDFPLRRTGRERMSLVVDVRDLLGEPGASRKVVVHEGVPALVTELARIPEERAVAGEFLVESVVD